MEHTRGKFFIVCCLNIYLSFANQQNSENVIRKKAVIFGVTGQDGAYLSEFLLAKEYEVHGVYRRNSLPTTGRIEHLINKNKKFKLHIGDITDLVGTANIIRNVDPDEIYDLAAQSHVGASFSVPINTLLVNGMGTLNILEAARMHNPKIRVYHASTSEMFGKVAAIPQNEETPFYPRSPYGVAKLYAHWIVKNYRESYNMFVLSGILFNHESPIRGEDFVTKKITGAIANILKGKQDCLYLGNLDAKRDWGFAGDYVEAMWLMLQQGQPKDYVVATGETHTVREFVEEAFKLVGITISWQGNGLDEVGLNQENNSVLVRIDKEFFRPAEVDLLLGDASLAMKELGWEPKVKFKDLVKLMMDAELAEKKEMK